MSEEVKTKILNGAETLFLRYGFKSITMDDIARELGLSKKTLYQFFEDKTKLVDETVARHIQQEMHFCSGLCQSVKNPIEYMLTLTDSFGELKKQINQTILFDLKKYFKPSWDKLNNFRVEFIYNEVLTNLRTGKNEGLYHAELNEELTAIFYIHLIDFLLNPDNYMEQKKDFKTVHNEMMRYHLRSICTEKGLKLLKKHSLFQSYQA
jgi:AcrR family transcriptional regulator